MFLPPKIFLEGMVFGFIWFFFLNVCVHSIFRMAYWISTKFSQKIERWNSSDSIENEHYYSYYGYYISFTWRFIMITQSAWLSTAQFGRHLGKTVFSQNYGLLRMNIKLLLQQECMQCSSRYQYMYNTDVNLSLYNVPLYYKANTNRYKCL